MDHPIISPKKLIEVALPLGSINRACVREKAIKHGHPSALHMWWARRPLAAARAVLFAQLVNDPSSKWELDNPGAVPPSNIKASWAASRKRLFSLIEELVQWESTTNSQLVEKCSDEIRKSWQETCDLNKDHPDAAFLFDPDTIPAFHDPFAGGGTLPLEAQRLGLNSIASDLNPVAVLINKAMIEIPIAFANHAPVGRGHNNSPGSRRTSEFALDRAWTFASGLADDVRHYGNWILKEAQSRIGHLYPPLIVTPEILNERPELKGLEGKSITVTAWLWARTVKSPNPAFSHVDVPLVSTFVLSSKKGKEVYVEPKIVGDKYSFIVKLGMPSEVAKKGTSAGKRQAFTCLMSNTPIDYNYIRSEGKAGRLGTKLMAVVAEGQRTRVYLSPTAAIEEVAGSAKPFWRPDCEMPQKHRNFQPPVYGMNNIGDLFTSRQLVALATFCDLIDEVKQVIRQNAVESGMADEEPGVEDGGRGALAYAESVCVYLAFSVSKLLDRCCSLVTWFPQRDSIYHAFGRQALPMTWDFAEANPLADGAGSFINTIKWEAEVIESFRGRASGVAYQAAAQEQRFSDGKVVSTDPPYYDNINYADLSDFFYVWLRRSLRSSFPKLLSTIAVPKAEELVASPNRHGSKELAESFFMTGMTKAMRALSEHAHPAIPATIYYAFKQSETKGTAGTSSTGWETFLEAVLRAGFWLTGTWPMRTELGNRLVGKDANALASSIILVCRRRNVDSRPISRRDFIRELNQVLPEALDEMTRGIGDEREPLAPVDLSQAIIGPGMAVFSKYSAVLEADGSPMTVRTALQLINRFLAEDDFDADTQFCLHWFEQFGWDAGKFGEADTLARAKGTSVDGVKQAGVLHAAGGNVRLLKWAEYPSDWDPQGDQRLPIWEVLHQLIRVFNKDGETGAAAVFAAVQSKAEAARQLAYRLYTLCERKNWAEDARAYNEVVTSWSGIESAAVKEPGLKQGELF